MCRSGHQAPPAPLGAQVSPRPGWAVAAARLGWTRWGRQGRARSGEPAQPEASGRFTFDGGVEPGRAVAATRSVPDPALAPEATVTFTAPHPTATLGSRPTHPDSCPRAPPRGPTDLSCGPPGPPSASLGPPAQVLAEQRLDSQARGTPWDAGTLDFEPLLGATAAAGPQAGPTGREEDGEEECPICTEPYGPGEHRLALLNCGHGLCASCLHQLLGTAPGADLGAARCPLCRQKTPMLEWEVCRLQEELLQADGPPRPPSPVPPAPPTRGPGPWASLEHRYRLRFLAGPVGGRGCLPFLPCPPRLGAWLWALRERGPCARRLALLGLLALELLGLLLIFTPLVLLGLLFALLGRSGH
ncbi:ring finger protein-like [Phyllostomus hastatus]|uniref:ring finger protein-like n=1 Tax=Phyllostomus hastatus TaxID=9423 RepID=UPI001E681D65|nr:ring finger protein-like [Phyllostomus hastatus]